MQLVKTHVSFLLLAMFSLTGTALAQVATEEQPATNSPTRADFISDASFIVGTYQPTSRDHDLETIVTATNAFLDSLDENQRDACTDSIDSPQRREWTNLPPRPTADGVLMKDLSDDQVKLACQMMAHLFSEQGYNKMRDIMLADDQLVRPKRRSTFGTEFFAIVIFGTPSTTEPWAFQLDGHHVGVNLSIAGESMTMAPSFIGTQPHKFSIAGTEYRPFAGETGLAHKLAMSLNDEQAKQAVIGTRRKEIVTGPGQDGVVPEPKGLSCSQLNEEQKEILVSLVECWVNDLPTRIAEPRMKQIVSEIDDMKFSWNGNRKSESDVSYALQSPTMIIEYACQDLGGNPLDHLHSNYRDPKNDYGGQLSEK